MAGKFTDDTTNVPKIKEWKAYAEGCEARFNAAVPVNPYPANSGENLAWARGVADVVAGDVDPCVASPGRPAAT